MPIQQAIFTSAQTQRGEGYQLVASSRGIWEEDERDLETCCPSHDALADCRSSINFHRLPSGAFCIARTTAERGEYSQRGGARVHTHCLIADPESLLRFANNPFALVRAAVASGALDSKKGAAQQLSEINLVGRASVVNKPLVDDYLNKLGPAGIAEYVAAVLSKPNLAVVGGDQTQRLLELAINCCPLECRVEIPFSSGLRYSPIRPFRLVGCCHDDAELQLNMHRFELVAWRPGSACSETPPALSGWGGFLSWCLREYGSAGLAAHLVRPRPGLSLETLGQLASELESSALSPRPADPPPESFPQPPASRPAASLSTRDTLQLSEASLAETVAVGDVRLQRLEAHVHEAISGRPGALDAITSLWPEIQAQIGHEQIDRSRGQFLGIAKQVWDEFMESGSDPQRAHAALNVVCVLFPASGSTMATES